ncbi:hypothetical protein HJC23_012221 [Cyclotella cryptica]|uniref:SD-repeat containing protein B domain-containing protein n=1 Tax=Cyclotella cryptica TaxID=29204 RepID=A0ABD3P4R0_9STRA
MKRSSLTILAIASSRLCLSSSDDTVESASAQASRDALHRHHDEIGSELSPQHRHRDRRRRRRDTENSAASSCIGSSLYPGQQIHTNEFLCHERQRFGIDRDGRLILGLAASSSSSSLSSSSNGVSPSAIAWQAVPTTLFLQDQQRPFDHVELSSYGNLVGYDEDGAKLYDSNLDYSNRIEGKSSGSVLGFSSQCDDLAAMPPGEKCIRLTSPPVPGSPYGVVTWGVAMDVDGMVSSSSSSVSFSTAEEDSPVMTAVSKPTRRPSTRAPSSLPPTTMRRSTDRPTEYPTTLTPSYEPTISPVVTSRAIIWGSVWLDSNANGGERYKAYFEVDDSYQFPPGADSNSHLETTGWTECVSPTIDDAVQWKVGLLGVATDDVVSIAAAEAVPSPVVANSKIGGAIFIDLNGDGTMNSAESVAVENGYTVPDAVVHVSLHDCETDVIVHSQDVKFPGEYSFGNLTEGLYKVEFDIVVITPNKQTKDSRLPQYSFFDDEQDVNSSSFETNCINLRRNDANLSVHAGIRIPKLKVNTKVSEDLEVGDMEVLSSATQKDEGNLVQATKVKAAASRSVEKKQSVPGIAAGILAVLALVVGSVLYIWHRRRSEDDMSVVSSVGSSVKGDVSAVSTPSAPTAIGSLIVESSTSVVDADMKAGDEECGSNHDSDDDGSEQDSQQEDCCYAVENFNPSETPQDTGVEVDLQFQHPYHRNPSSIFETESLDSDPYIYTGDEQEYDEDYHKWGEHAAYPQSTSPEMLESGVQCHQDGSYVGNSTNYGAQSYYYDEDSSVVSNRSSDPPAASYRNLPSVTHVYEANEHMRAMAGVYHNPPSNNNRCESFDSDDSSSSSEESESSSSRSSSSSTNNLVLESNRSQSAPPSRPHAGWTQHSMMGEGEPNEHSLSQHHGYYVGPIVDDQSVLSAQSDHSTDPPGASYQTLGHSSYRGSRRSFTPPPPGRPFPPPPPPRR